MTTTDRSRRRAALAALALGAGLLLGCEGADLEYEYPRPKPGGGYTYDEPESIFGPDGLTLFDSLGLGGSGEAAPGGGAVGVGVNAFLWRASLDTVAFMPLRSADPFGGVILTDWYAPPETAGERFKVDIHILDRALRSDGVRARVFKQTRAGDGGWTDAAADPARDRRLEDAILTRARQLRVRAAPSPD